MKNVIITLALLIGSQSAIANDLGTTTMIGTFVAPGMKSSPLNASAETVAATFKGLLGNENNEVVSFTSKNNEFNIKATKSGFTIMIVGNSSDIKIVQKSDIASDVMLKGEIASNLYSVLNEEPIEHSGALLKSAGNIECTVVAGPYHDYSNCTIKDITGYQSKGNKFLFF